MVHRSQKDPKQAKSLLAYFDWCFEHGALQAETLQYVPMPKSVIDEVRELWKREITVNGEPVYAP